MLLQRKPIKGTASDVLGIVSETVFKNTVSDRRTVTSERFMIMGKGPFKFYILDH